MRLAENTGRKKSSKKSPSAHHRTTLSGYIFATKARIDNRKKLVNGPFVHGGGLSVLSVGTLLISFSNSVKIMRFYDFGSTFTAMSYKMNFWRILLHVPPVASLYSCSFSGRRLDA